MDSVDASLPTEADALRIVSKTLGVEAITAHRFSTGLCHCVYDVERADGNRVVARIAPPHSIAQMRGGIVWHPKVRSLGLPLPTLLAADAKPDRFGFTYMVLERLPGHDLGEALRSLRPRELSDIAKTVIGWGHKLQALKQHETYGYSTSPERPPACPDWIEVVEAEVERARLWLEAAPWFSTVYVEELQQRIEQMSDYLSRVEPTPYLPDATTKNVIVQEGKVIGLVDVDEMGFGDPLQALGLTFTALRANSLPDDYAQAWLKALELTTVQHRAVVLYALIACATFMGETGQSFNQTEPPAPDPAYRNRLTQLFAGYTQEFQEA